VQLGSPAYELAYAVEAVEAHMGHEISAVFSPAPAGMAPGTLNRGPAPDV
jgi:hypothetical protein